MRVKTGILGLDKILSGGFPPKSSLLLVGPPGCGKSTMAQQFISQGIKEQQSSIYTTLDSSPNDIMGEMSKLGFKVEKEKNLKFIDAYSWRVGKTKGKYVISNLGNINELNIMISEVISSLNKSNIKRSVFDSVSTLLLYADPQMVVKFIPVVIAKGRDNGYTQMFLLEEGVHDQKTVTTLNYLCDGLIKFKMEEDRRLLKIDRLKGTAVKRNWIEFDVTDKGIKIKG